MVETLATIPAPAMAAPAPATSRAVPDDTTPETGAAGGVLTVEGDAGAGPLLRFGVPIGGVAASAWLPKGLTGSLKGFWPLGARGEACADETFGRLSGLLPVRFRDAADPATTPAATPAPAPAPAPNAALLLGLKSGANCVRGRMFSCGGFDAAAAPSGSLEMGGGGTGSANPADDFSLPDSGADSSACLFLRTQKNASPAINAMSRMIPMARPALAPPDMPPDPDGAAFADVADGLTADAEPYDGLVVRVPATTALLVRAVAAVVLEEVAKVVGIARS